MEYAKIKSITADTNGNVYGLHVMGDVYIWNTTKGQWKLHQDNAVKVLPSIETKTIEDTGEVK